MVSRCIGGVLSPFGGSILGEPCREGLAQALPRAPRLDSSATSPASSKTPAPLNPAEAGILAMLALAAKAGDELTGYDLKAWADSSVGYFWSSAKSQIYAVLARLDDRGLIRCRHVAQSHRPDKNLYTITGSGQRALDAWLGQPLQATPARNLLLLRVFFGALSSKDAVIGDIKAYVEQARALRRELEEIDDESRRLGKMNVYYAITREYGFALCDMVEAWAKRAIRDVRRADADGRIPAAPRRPKPRRQRQPNRR